MSHHVFISYAARDKAIADAACSKLEGRRLRCWIAPRDVLAGTNYAEAIVDAINASRLLVVVFSSTANDSAHVMREVERCVRRGIPILPFRIENVVPSKSMEYFLSASHWLDAMTPPLETHLNALADTIAFLLDGSPQLQTAHIMDQEALARGLEAPAAHQVQPRGGSRNERPPENISRNIKTIWLAVLIFVIAAIVGVIVLVLRSGGNDASQFIYPIF